MGLPQFETERSISQAVSQVSQFASLTHQNFSVCPSEPQCTIFFHVISNAEPF